MSMLVTQSPVKSESNVAVTEDVIKEKDVELIHLHFVDIEGMMKSVTVTADQLKDIEEGNIMFDGSSIKGFTPINKSDLYLKP
ncbi:glutamine synthetase beta-Grasp [Evansella cellulosilytica DSM 2522]|uniref:Glutamine synthetase beta-Grasp n=1 Tax=Evansella cellulosilytica (strain ATCC 21833 / DSM 2522 / FERM P-1141 / JCM 9156 / N-4) TaxID=649639 RepID=E6TU17_EVAC2|nr:glutamine synthetase beta-Grasp [Evansella cellulosilytica DSM 2522]